MRRKIAFVHKGTVPLASGHVGRRLEVHFPHLELQAIDVKDLLLQRRDIMLFNLLHTFRDYGGDILTGRKRVRETFFRTTYLFRRVKALLAETLAEGDYAFSFQMQSLYDASVSGVPNFVYTDHTNLANLLYPVQDRNRLYSPGWQRLERTIYQNAAHIFTRSHNITRSLIQQYQCDPERVTCVYAGSNAQIEETPLRNDDYHNKNILFVGIDWERKGGPDLVAAFHHVLESHPDARLTIVGCEPQIDVPNCRVVGRVAPGEVDDFYRGASIFCLPTLLEPFGIVFVEAFARRLPIVATRVGAIPDLVAHGENGYLVEAGDRASLAHALIRLLDDPARCRTYGARGYQLVRERYTWEQVGRRLHDRISNILNLA